MFRPPRRPAGEARRGRILDVRKSPLKDNSGSCAADACRLAASLVAHIPTGMLVPRSLPSGRVLNNAG